MSLHSISSCPICNNNLFNSFLTCTDFTASKESFSIKQCSTCSFTITDPSPDKESIGDYYLSDKYISHTGGGKSLFERIYVLARNVTLRWKQVIVEENSTGKTILDVGCGTGEFLGKMKIKGWNSLGIEPSSIARKSAEQKTGNKIYEQIAEVKESNFDAISLWHVMEHLPDLNDALNKLHSLLKESGTIFIAVPNHRAYDAQYYQAYWAGYDVPRHLWHFTQDNMKALLHNNGFSLVKIIPMPLDSFYVSLLSESYKYPSKNRLFALIHALWIGLVSNLKAKKNLDYSSLIYIAKR